MGGIINILNTACHDAWKFDANSGSYGYGEQIRHFFFSKQFYYYDLLHCCHHSYPYCGIFIRSYREKKVIIPSLIITGIGGLIAAWAGWKMEHPYWMILIGRALQGAGAAGAFPIVMPLIGDMFKTDEEVSSSLGLIETSNTLGKVLSPILGAFLAGFYWFIPFFQSLFFV